MKRHLALALILTAPLLLQGCGEGGHKLIDPPAFVYPDQSTPKNTLLRMAAAVERRDSVVTASVYADGYEGSSSDLTDPNSTTLQFFKSDEVRAVGEMARSNSIHLIEMDLGVTAGWLQYHNVSDPVGWVTIQIPNFQIYVNDTVEGEYRTSSPTQGETHVFEFTLKPTTPDPTSPTDTTWTIIQWVESRASL